MRPACVSFDLTCSNAAQRLRRATCATVPHHHRILFFFFAIAGTGYALMRTVTDNDITL